MEIEFLPLVNGRSPDDISSIIDIHTTLNRVYVLREHHEVEIYDLELSLIQTIELSKSSKQCLKIFSDATTLIIAFEDGTLELRQIAENYQLLRVTYDRDAAGPGAKYITQVSASPDYVLVQSYENGLLIYSKPSLLFYKWIMLGGHCEVIHHSIKYHFLYVLIDRPEHEIHMLDFEKHRIFEQEVLAYDYIDIEFDGIYLYAATSTSVIVYLQEEAERPMKQSRVAQVNFKDKIHNLIRYNDEIYVVFKGSMVELDIEIPEFEKPNITTGQQIPLQSPTIAKKLKYDYFSSQPHETTALRRTIIYQEEDGSLWKVIISDDE